MKPDQVRAVISGGASGLGLATAARLVAGGGRVALLDVQDAAGQQAAAKLGAAASYHRCDVTDESGVDAAVQAAAARMGGLNVSVACAGVATPGKLLGKDGPLPVAAFQRVLAINTLGAFPSGGVRGTASAVDGARRRTARCHTSVPPRAARWAACPVPGLVGRHRSAGGDDLDAGRP